MLTPEQQRIFVAARELVEVICLRGGRRLTHLLMNPMDMRRIFPGLIAVETSGLQLVARGDVPIGVMIGHTYGQRLSKEFVN